MGARHTLARPPHADGHGYFARLEQPDQLQSRTWPMVFEHDVPLDPDTLGCPVLNLNGQAVGISIAAAG